MPMNIKTCFIVLLSLMFVLPAAAEWQPDPGFTSLFNGKDLSGWCFRDWKKESPTRGQTTAVFDGQTQSNDNGRYFAMDGILTVNYPKGVKRLISRMGTEKEFTGDFILKIEFRASVGADSGIFLRNKQLQCRDYLVAGPYKELKQYKPQEWNLIEVVVKDNIARCTCNGEVLEEAYKIPAQGPIALEGDRGQMEYRHIQIKMLD